MSEKLLEIILPVKNETGLEIEVYDGIGDRIAATDPASPHMLADLPDFSGTIWQDAVADVTVFRIESGSERLLGAIAGAGPVSRNYAALVARLLEAGLDVRTKPIDRSAEFRMLLEGDLGRLQTERMAAKYPEFQPYYILVFSVPDRKDLVAYLKDLGTENDFVFATHRNEVVMMKNTDGLAEYQSISDFAHMVCENAEQELGFCPIVGVGDAARELKDIPGSYQKALTALRLGKLLDGRARVYNSKDYFLVTLFEELPREKVASYLSEEIDSETEEIFEDAEMMETAEQFMLGSLNISDTARRMFMHRNTLIYRLDKIEKATGLNIRRFADAMTFRTLSMLYKINKKDKRK